MIKCNLIFNFLGWEKYQVSESMSWRIERDGEIVGQLTGFTLLFGLIQFIYQVLIFTK